MTTESKKWSLLANGHKKKKKKSRSALVDFLVDLPSHYSTTTSATVWFSILFITDHSFIVFSVAVFLHSNHLLSNEQYSTTHPHFLIDLVSLQEKMIASVSKVLAFVALAQVCNRKEILRKIIRESHVQFFFNCKITFFLGGHCPTNHHWYHSLFPITSWYLMGSSHHIPTSWQQ